MENPEGKQSESLGRGSKRRLWGIFLLLAFLLLGTLVIGNWFAGRPESLGATDGRLSPCPDSPNCVCSQDDRPSHQIDPFRFEGDGAEAFSRLGELLKSWPRTRIVKQTETYLHVEFTTPILRFVDDGEFLLDEDNQQIHVRSASRIGRTDMGTNRKRIEKIREAFASQGG